MGCCSSTPVEPGVISTFDGIVKPPPVGTAAVGAGKGAAAASAAGNVVGSDGNAASAAASRTGGGGALVIHAPRTGSSAAPSTGDGSGGRRGSLTGAFHGGEKGATPLPLGSPTLSAAKRTTSLLAAPVDPRALAELPSAAVIAAAFNDVAYFSALITAIVRKANAGIAAAVASGTAAGDPVAAARAEVTKLVSLLAFTKEERYTHGADVVEIACAAGSADVLELLLAACPSISSHVDSNKGNTLLHYATLGPRHVSGVYEALRSHLLHNPELTLICLPQGGGTGVAPLAATASGGSVSPQLGLDLTAGPSSPHTAITVAPAAPASGAAGAPAGVGAIPAGPPTLGSMPSIGGAGGGAVVTMPSVFGSTTGISTSGSGISLRVGSNNSVGALAAGGVGAGAGAKAGKPKQSSGLHYLQQLVLVSNQAVMAQSSHATGGGGSGATEMVPRIQESDRIEIGIRAPSFFGSSLTLPTHHASGASTPGIVVHSPVGLAAHAPHSRSGSALSSLVPAESNGSAASGGSSGSSGSSGGGAAVVGSHSLGSSSLHPHHPHHQHGSGSHSLLAAHPPGSGLARESSQDLVSRAAANRIRSGLGRGGSMTPAMGAEVVAAAAGSGTSTDVTAAIGSSSLAPATSPATAAAGTVEAATGLDETASLSESSSPSATPSSTEGRSKTPPMPPAPEDDAAAPPAPHAAGPASTDGGAAVAVVAAAPAAVIAAAAGAAPVVPLPCLPLPKQVELTNLPHRFPPRSVSRVVSVLLARGLSKSQKNTFGRRPYDLALVLATQIQPEGSTGAVSMSGASLLCEGSVFERLLHQISVDWDAVAAQLFDPTTMPTVIGMGAPAQRAGAGAVKR